MRRALLLCTLALIGPSATAQDNVPLPTLPPPQSIPKPAADTGQPYIPQAILPGGVVVPLFPPDSPYLKADKLHVPEVYNLSQAVPGRISSIVSIHNPSIEVHLVEKSLNTGTAIIVIAGGGHRTLNVGGEAADFVPFFYNYGINTIILRNRLRADGYVAEVDAVRDAQQAVRVVRAYAKKWGIDPHRIGVMGFSAGAELGAPAAILYEDWDKKNSGPADPFADISSRPDFVGIVYPGPTPFARGRTSPPIPKDAPPAFIVCGSAGDRVHTVWALEYYQAMLTAGVPNVELHFYGNGRHPGDPLPDGSRMSGGLTDRGGIPFGTWQYRFIDWARDLGFLQKPGVETKAAKDVAAYVANPLRPIGQGRGGQSRTEGVASISAIGDRMKPFIEGKEIAGAVTLVATPDRIAFVDATGKADLETGKPMRSDSIFWIASMTKPVTATAVLMLQDEGKLSVDDPVEKYLPEFKDLKTADGKPVKLTIRHLLTHTSGMGEITPDEARPIKNLAGVIPLYVAKPVQFEPGSKWAYCQSGINTAARIVEVTSGESFDRFVEKRLFSPLGMKDTSFYLTEEHLPRLATSYRRTDKGELEAAQISILYGKSPTSRDRFPAANGGLFSTAPDYVRFCQMILNGGEFDGKRYVKPESVALMTGVQTGDLKPGFTPGNGWGLGWCVTREPQGLTARLSPGTFGHGGAYGTQAWIDPVKKRIYVLMIQRANFPNSDASEVRGAFQEAANSAMEREERQSPYPKSVRIFDGKTFNGWEADPSTWSITDGAMRGFAGSSRLAYTKADYGNFRLVFTSRMDPVNGDHLGVLFWGDRPKDPTKPKIDNAGWLQFMPPFGGMWDYHPPKHHDLPHETIAKGVRDSDRWHTTELLCDLRKGTVRAAVDGVEIVRYRHKDSAERVDPEKRIVAGPIGMFRHGAGASEYKEIYLEVDPQEDRLITVPRLN